MDSKFDLPTTESRRRLFERFQNLKIPTFIVPYPAHSTVEEGKALRGNMPGTFTKNLLLKDKKGRMFLLAIDEDRVLDLKTLHTRIGASGRLGFVPGERMIDVLGVSPGALTPLAVINDEKNIVNVVIDASLLKSEQINFHPLTQTESTGLNPDELLSFIRSCDREPVLVDFESEMYA